MRRAAAALARPAAALASSAAIVAIALLALGASPPAVFAALFEGAFGSWYAFTDTIVKATPLVFAGLAVAIAFSGGLWNIGADGQLTIGALFAGAAGISMTGVPWPIAIPATLAAGAVGGGLWGGAAGWLRARRGVNEVIGTIMLNFIAIQILSWAVHGPLMEPSRAYPTSPPIASSAQFAFYLEPSRLNFGMLTAVALAIVCYVALFRSARGFEVRAMGRNPRAARFAGISVAGLSIGTMTACGAIAGMGGAVQVCAITHRLFEKLSPGWGYEAIAVALVARLNPLAVVAAAFFFGALDNGSQAMQRELGVSPVLVQVIEGLVILILLAFDTPAWARVEAMIAPAHAETLDA